MDAKNTELLLKKNLSKWLDETDNRLYCVWSSKTCNLYTIERDDKVVDHFIGVLKQNLDIPVFEGCTFTVRPLNFTIHFGTYDIEIDAFDDVIIHTKDYKEDNYEQ